MLTSHFVQQQGMDLSLPKSNSKASSMENKLEIIISKKADIFVNDQKVKIEELKDVIANHSQDKSVILKADKSISHGIVVEIMDKIRSNGNKKIIIATQKREKK
jgi:biopolymer transport protein ExbD